MASQHGTGFDAGVIADAYLSAHDDVVFDGDTSGEAGLSGDDDVLADLDVVADVHEVVNFRAATDAGFVEGSAVDGGVGADFDIVFDHQASDLGGLLVASSFRIADVAEACTAQNSAGLHDDAVAESCARVDGDVRIEAAMASDHDVVADYCTWADGGFIADLDVFAENRARADGYVLAEHSGRGNDGGGMNAAIRVGIAEQPGGAGEGEARLGGNQDGLGGAGAGGEFCGREIPGDHGGGG